MTSRERVLAALKHRTPDRTPIFEYVLQPPVADYVLGHVYAYGNRWNALVKEIGWEAAVRRQASDIVALADNLGHDLLYVCPSSPPPAPEGKPVEPAPRFDDPVEEMRWRIDREASMAGNGLADAPYLIYHLVREEMARVGMDLVMMAPAYAHGVWTDVALMQAMLLDPDLAHRHFALQTLGALRQINTYLRMGIELIGVGGDFAGNRGPLVSPAAYREFMAPEIRKLSQRVHAAGGYTVNASDGNLWPVIHDFLVGCEVDGYIEIDWRAGMELSDLKKKFGARITFFGNLDCANLLSFGTPAEVKAHTRDCLRQGWGNGGHVLCCNNAISESVPVGNYLAIGEAYREHFQV